MLHIVNSCNDPYWNLALEEYFLKSAPSSDDIVILWRNSPAVVIGRNQNTIAEINQAFIAANHVDVVRRLSGGGAVYHDLGNLNFTFITAASAANRNNFAIFTIPIINALAEFGITAAFTGRNDLTIARQKFSGNAQYIHRGRLLHHGTLLFDTDLTAVAQALSGSATKYSTRAVPSVRSRVTTIRQHLPSALTLAEFEAALLKAIFAHAGAPYKCYQLSAADRQAIENLATSRYQDPVWNYGSLPPYNIARKQTFPGGTVQALLTVQDGILRQTALYGDFFATDDMNELTAALCGIPFTREAVGEILIPWLGEHPIHNILPSDLLACFFPE